MSISTVLYHQFEFSVNFSKKNSICQIRENVRFLEKAGKLARFVTSSQDVVEARGALLELPAITS